MDASKPKFEDGLDVIKAGSPQVLLKMLRDQSQARIVSIYAVGDMHYAWLDRGKSKAPSKEEVEKKAAAEAKVKEEAKIMEQLKAEEAQKATGAQTGAAVPQTN